jgi:steroid delta-isomerase
VTTERSRKQIALEHCRRMTAGDVDGLLAMYAPEAVFESPVGWLQQQGHEALRAYLSGPAAAQVRETAGEPVAGQDGEHVILPVTAVMRYQPLGPVYMDRGWLPAQPDPEPAGLRCRYMMLLRIGAGGLIEDMRSFWGRGDLETIS